MSLKAVMKRFHFGHKGAGVVTATLRWTVAFQQSMFGTKKPKGRHTSFSLVFAGRSMTDWVLLCILLSSYAFTVLAV